MAMPVLSPADLPPWIEEADILREKLRTNYRSLEPFITEELQHYLADPDIRLKDAGYKERQDKIIGSLISNLESGKIDEVAHKIKALGNSVSLWHSGLLRALFITCVPYVLLQTIAFMFGYGSWVHLIAIPATIVFVIASLGAACIYGNKIKYQIGLKDAVIVILLCILVSFISYEIGFYARVIYRTPLLNSAKQITDALDQYKVEHGTYPTDSQYLSLLPLSKNIRVYKGTFEKGEITWDVFDLGESDITVLVEPKEYGVYVPVEKMSPISFSSFSVYRYYSSDPKWVLGRVHWRIGGAHWSDD